LNDSTKQLTMYLNVGPLSSLKWELMLQFDTSMEMQSNFMGNAMERPGDEFKSMLLNTHPLLLCITFIVTLLHSIFDFLTFKNCKINHICTYFLIKVI
jgi:hypothetical protein